MSIQTGMGLLRRAGAPGQKEAQCGNAASAASPAISTWVRTSMLLMLAPAASKYVATKPKLETIQHDRAALDGWLKRELKATNASL